MRKGPSSHSVRAVEDRQRLIYICEMSLELAQMADLSGAPSVGADLRDVAETVMVEVYRRSSG